MLDYEGLTVRDLKRIVNREEATPAAIGLFIVHDAWRRDHRLPYIISNELLRWIEEKWRFKTFANELDYWVGLAEHLNRLEYGVTRARLASVTTNLDIFMSIIFTEGYLYGAAFAETYRQAAAAGLKIKIPGLTAKQTEALAARASDLSVKDTPTPPKRIEEARKQAQSHLASLLATRNVMEDAAALLAIPGLVEDINGALHFLRVQANRHDKDYLEGMEAIAPKWARQLRRMVDYEPVEPDKEREAQLESALSLYLTPQWRRWARAGVSLREIAESSTGIVDLIQRAEQAAAELNNERQTE